MEKPNLKIAATSQFKIEKGAPVPIGAGGSRKYPFPDMEVGDSFVVPRDIAISVRNAAFAYGKVHDRKYCVRKQADGSSRCWRTA